MSAERDKIVAYLRGMATALEKRRGGGLADSLRSSIGAGMLLVVADQIANGHHEQAPTLFPEHMPPRYTIRRADA